MRDWKPGDVQVVLSMHPSRVQEFAVWLKRSSIDGSRLHDYAEQIEAQGHGARLVVIDPEDREQVERLADLLLEHHATGPAVSHSGVAAALRSLTEPPKPEEPQGRYAEVLAGDGRLWVRWTDSERSGRNWMRPGTDGETAYARWDDLTVLRVLSEGVTEGGDPA